MKPGRELLVGAALALALRTRPSRAFGPASTAAAAAAFSRSRGATTPSSPTSLDMARNRGLERLEEYATPLRK